MPPQPSTGAPRWKHHGGHITSAASAPTPLPMQSICVPRPGAYRQPLQVPPHTATHPAPTTPIIRATCSRRVARWVRHNRLSNQPQRVVQDAGCLPATSGGYYSCQDPQSDTISSNSHPLPYFPAGREPVDRHAVRSRNDIKTSVTSTSSDGSAYLLLHSRPLGLSFC